MADSIFTPDADVVKGYNKCLMLSYGGPVSFEVISLILEYFRHPDR